MSKEKAKRRMEGSYNAEIINETQTVDPDKNSGSGTMTAKMTPKKVIGGKN